MPRSRRQTDAWRGVAWHGVALVSILAGQLAARRHLDCRAVGAGVAATVLAAGVQASGPSAAAAASPSSAEGGRALQAVGQSGSQTVGQPQRSLNVSGAQLTCDCCCAPHECCDSSASISDRASRFGPCDHCREWPMLPGSCEEGAQQAPCQRGRSPLPHFRGGCQDHAPEFVMSASSAAGVAFRAVRHERGGACAASPAISAAGAQRRAARVAVLATSGSPALYRGPSISTCARRTALAQEPPS